MLVNSSPLLSMIGPFLHSTVLQLRQTIFPLYHSAIGAANYLLYCSAVVLHNFSRFPLTILLNINFASLSRLCLFRYSVFILNFLHSSVYFLFYTFSRNWYSQKVFCAISFILLRHLWPNIHINSFLRYIFVPLFTFAFCFYVLYNFHLLTYFLNIFRHMFYLITWYFFFIISFLFFKFLIFSLFFSLDECPNSDFSNNFMRLVILFFSLLV